MKFFAVFVAFLLMSFLPERQTKILQEIRLKIPELANYIYSFQNSKS